MYSMCINILHYDERDSFIKLQSVTIANSVLYSVSVHCIQFVCDLIGFCILYCFYGVWQSHPC